MMGDAVSAVRSCVAIIFVFTSSASLVTGNNDVMVLITECVCPNGLQMLPLLSEIKASFAIVNNHFATQ